jgi:hypothetical protein
MSYFVPGMTAVQLDTHTTAIRKVLEDARIKFIDRGKSGGPRG